MRKKNKDYFAVYQKDEFLDCWVRLFLDIFSTREELEELKKLKIL